METIPVITINDYESVPAGTVFDVIKETKYFYYGYWSSMFGTYKIKMKKSNCEPYDPKGKHKSIVDQIMEFIRNNPDDPAIKAANARFLEAKRRARL